MSPRYRHRKSRPLHTFRYGWQHFTQHRDGIRHRHTRRRQRKIEEVKISQWKEVPPHYAVRELRRQFLLGAVASVAIIITWAGIFGALTALKIKHELAIAQTTARHVAHSRQRLLTPLGRYQVSREIAQMERQSFLADQQVHHSAPLTLLSWIPVLGTQIHAIQRDTHAVSMLARQGQLLLAAATNAANTSHGNHVDLITLNALDQQVHASNSVLAGLTASTSGLYGPVSRMQRDLNQEVVQISTLLNQGGHALDFAQSFLGGQGSRTYLVAGENSSEMRDQGAVLSWSLLSVTSGTFAMSHAQSVGAVSLARPAAAITDPGTQAAFGPLQPTRVWQNVNAVGSFPTSAAWMRAMLAQTNGTHVDGVLGLDVAAIADILKVIGPVTVAGIHKPVTATNVESLLYHTLYMQYPVGSQQARHDLVSAVATAAVDKMKHGGYDLAALVQSLATAIPGRHLVFWDSNPLLERDVTSFNASGLMQAQGDQSLHLAIEAGVAAKLDWYISSRVRYDVTFSSNGTAYVTETITLHNAAPRNPRPSYAFGPDNTNSHKAGEYIARLYQWLPPQAESPGAQLEEGLMLSRTILRVDGQQTRSVVLNAIIPHMVRNGVIRWNFVPQSTIHPTMITVHVADNLGVSGPLTATWRNNHPVTLTWSTR